MTGEIAAKSFLHKKVSRNGGTLLHIWDIVY